MLIKLDLLCVYFIAQLAKSNSAQSRRAPAGCIKKCFGGKMWKMFVLVLGYNLDLSGPKQWSAVLSFWSDIWISLPKVIHMIGRVHLICRCSFDT